MAVKALSIEAERVNFIGLSTDTKPTASSHDGLPSPVTGSTFVEHDTGSVYITYDGTNWKLKDLAINALVTKLRHPFAKGSLTTNGVQYCTAQTGVDNSAYVEVESITFQQPADMTLEEIEFGLTGAVKVDGSGSTDDINWKWQASDDGSSWEDLISEQTESNTNTFTDVSCSGRFAPTGNFLGTGSSFKVRMVIKSSGATDTVSGKTKNSSYILAKYRRV